MTNLGIRDVLGVTLISTWVGMGGALCGYIYAKLADLPCDQVAKAWAVWNAAETALVIIAVTFTENHRTQKVITATILGITTTIGIQVLQKRNLIEKYMVISLIAIRAIRILCILFLDDDATALENNDAIPEA